MLDHCRKLFAAAAVVSLLGGCAASQPRLSVDVETCCEARFERYRSYRVTMTKVPGFLQPYLRGGLDTVLRRKGLEPTLDRPDLDVHLIFDQIYLSPDSTTDDYFGEGVAPEDATRFMAAVSVDVIDSSSERLVWSGRLSRIHNNPLGQPRGNDHKMQGIIDGFNELFAEYPMLLAEDNDPD